MTELPFISDWAVRFGEVLRLIMEDDGLTIQDVADQMDVSASVVDLFLSGDDVTVDPSLAGKLETATGFPARCWINLESQYRNDAARLMPGRIGLFDNLDAFVQAEGESAELLKGAVLGSLIFHGDKDRARMAGILANTNEYVILMEKQEDNLHLQIRFGRFGQAYVIMGPRAAEHIAPVMPAATGGRPETKPVDLSPATIEAETTCTFVAA